MTNKDCRFECETCKTDCPCRGCWEQCEEKCDRGVQEATDLKHSTYYNLLSICR